MRALRVTALAVLGLLLPEGLAQGADGIDGRWDLAMVRDTPGLVRDVKGVIVLEREGKAWKGELTFELLMNGQRQTLSDVTVKGKKVAFTVRALSYEFEGELAKESLKGICRSKEGNRWKWTATRQKPPAAVDLFETGLAAAGFYPRGDAKAQGLRPERLWTLVREAEAADTDALIVWKDGKVVCERTFGREGGRIHVMSVTKFVTGLALGFLLEEGKIESLDTAVSRWFPAWEGGERGKVTVRHLATHTSGIVHGATARALNEAQDKVAYVLGLDVHGPGSEWSYNNEAVALLSGIISKSAGRPCDEYLAGKLFEPIEIETAAWDRDAAGNTITYAQLGLSARDLTRIGALVADRGKSGGKAVLSEKTLDLLAGRATEASPTQGLLWFRVLDGDEAVGVRHDGWLGQHLVVYPRERLVGVRLRRGRQGEDPRYELGSFPARVRDCLDRP